MHFMGFEIEDTTLFISSDVIWGKWAPILLQNAVDWTKLISSLDTQNLFNIYCPPLLLQVSHFSCFLIPKFPVFQLLSMISVKIPITFYYKTTRNCHFIIRRYLWWDTLLLNIFLQANHRYQPNHCTRKVAERNTCCTRRLDSSRIQLDLTSLCMYSPLKLILEI